VVRFLFAVAAAIAGKLLMVTLIFASWNQLERWLRQLEGLRRAA
jgi:hypothetical protein